MKKKMIMFLMVILTVVGLMGCSDNNKEDNIAQSMLEKYEKLYNDSNQGDPVLIRNVLNSPHLHYGTATKEYSPMPSTLNYGENPSMLTKKEFIIEMSTWLAYQNIYKFDIKRMKKDGASVKKYAEDFHYKYDHILNQILWYIPSAHTFGAISLKEDKFGDIVSFEQHIDSKNPNMLLNGYIITNNIDITSQYIQYSILINDALYNDNKVFKSIYELNNITKNEEISKENAVKIWDASKDVNGATSDVMAEDLANKQWENKEELSKAAKSSEVVVYDRTKKTEYELKINAVGYTEYGQLDFNKNGIFLQVSKDIEGEEYPEFYTYDMLELYATVIFNNPSYKEHLKIKGDKAYKIEFDDDSFGIAFLFEDEDDIYVGVVRFGTIAVGVNHMQITQEAYPIRFKVDNEYYFNPNFERYLIESIVVEDNNVIITYGAGDKEYWKPVFDETELNYILKKVK